MSQEPTTSATRHSGEGLGPSSSNMTDPPQVMNPNVEQNQSQETTSVKQQPPDDASLRPKKRERKEEGLTPKSEQSQAEVKEGVDQYMQPRLHGPQNRRHDTQKHLEGPQTRMHKCSIEQFGLSMTEVLMRTKIHRLRSEESCGRRRPISRH